MRNCKDFQFLPVGSGLLSFRQYTRYWFWLDFLCTCGSRDTWLFRRYFWLFVRSTSFKPGHHGLDKLSFRVFYLFAKLLAFMLELGDFVAHFICFLNQIFLVYHSFGYIFFNIIGWCIKIIKSPVSSTFGRTTTYPKNLYFNFDLYLILNFLSVLLFVLHFDYLLKIKLILP